MLHAAVTGFTAIFAFPALPLMLLGVVIGFVVGVLPGLGGATALALMIPFTFSMTPIEAFAFLLGMHACASAAGDITSILFGVPGEGTAAALILDGHPMAKNGEAARAIGAAVFSSLIGAIVGAIALAASIPIVEPLVLSMGSPELFMLTILGMTFLGTLSGGSVLRGLTSGFFGFLLATIGIAQILPIERYTFHMIYLFDGLSLIPVAIGLFAIPEIIDLAVRGSSIAAEEAAEVGDISGVVEGVRDTFRHIGLVLRTSVIGTFIGIVPGLGGAVAQWVTYGHAIQSSKDPSRFGHGAVEGVLGPAAAVNSKEGGSLIPTVAFAIPGSLSMAILLGAFLIVGLQPGPSMLKPAAEGGALNVTYSMVWILVISHVILVGVVLLFINQIARITKVRPSIIIPFLLLLIALGSFSSNNDFNDIGLMLFFGLLGYFMVLFHWPRPPMILGLVLGTLSEQYLFITVKRYTYHWLTFPGVIVIFIVAVAALIFPLYQQRRARLRQEAMQERGAGPQ